MSSNTVNINGNEYQEDVARVGLQIMNARDITPTSGQLGGAGIGSDASIRRWLGDQYDGNRDIYDVLGYDELDTDQALEKYRAKYERQDIAKRVIEAFPKETWKEPPTVVDGEEDTTTSFEEKLNTHIERELNAYWRRSDIAQRLGEYGILMIGYADGQSLDKEVQTSAISSLEDVAFYNVFPQEQVDSWTLGKELSGDKEENKPNHPRYNKPVYYNLDFGDIGAESTEDDINRVHYTRVVHIAEGSLETDLKGSPALKPIYNRLQDREKVIGASAEMFYTGADRKIIANVKDEFALPQYEDESQRENFQEDLSRLINDLQQTMVGTGMDYEVISGQEVNPQGVIKEIDASIASAVGLPMNKLRGNETGERSTTMDRNNWFDEISSRQSSFAGPNIVRKTVDSLVDSGAIPSPENGDYGIEWPDLDQPTEADKAETQSKRASALGGSQLAMTLSSEQKLQYLKGGPEAVDTDTEPVQELPLNEDNPDVQEQFQASFNQDVDLTPPESAQNNAQRVLDWRDDSEKNVQGMNETGWDRARQLASGEELSPQDVQEIYAWFARHGPEEGELNEDIPEDEPWRDNGRVAILGWGGETMREWVGPKRRRLTELGELEPVE